MGSAVCGGLAADADCAGGGHGEGVDHAEEGGFAAAAAAEDGGGGAGGEREGDVVEQGAAVGQRVAHTREADAGGGHIGCSQDKRNAGLGPADCHAAGLTWG